MFTPRDTARINRAVSQFLAVSDTTAQERVGFEYALAVATGDSATVRAIRERVQAGDPTAANLQGLVWAFNVRHVLSLPYEDTDLWYDILKERQGIPLAWYPLRSGLERGRPSDVIKAHMESEPGWGGPVGNWKRLIEWWLAYPGFDSIAAVAVDTLRVLLPRRDPDRPCYLMLYRALAGDTVGVRDVARAMEPRRAHELGVCPAMLEAVVESHDRDRSDTPALDRLESLWYEAPLFEWPYGSYPLLVRLRRRRGQYERALELARAGWERGWGSPGWFTPLLKQEGDLACIVGDTAGAIEAYDRYLRHKIDPDPGPAATEVDSVRGAMEMLKAAWSGRERR